MKDNLRLDLGGRGVGQKVLSKPSADSFAVGRRQKYLTTASIRLLAGDQHMGNCMGTKTFSDLGLNNLENVAIVMILGSQLSICTQNAHIPSVFLQALNANTN
jgi:hypothetical protein